MPRYYRRSYYTPGNPKELYYGNKILLVSHLESLDLKELINQKNIYTEQASKINDYFNGEKFKESEEKIKDSITVYNKFEKMNFLKSIIFTFILSINYLKKK